MGVYEKMEVLEEIIRNLDKALFELGYRVNLIYECKVIFVDEDGKKKARVEIEVGEPFLGLDYYSELKHIAEKTGASDVTYMMNEDDQVDTIVLYFEPENGE